MERYATTSPPDTVGPWPRMIPVDHAAHSTASVYVVVLTAIAWAWRRPSARAMSGALLAAIWNLPVVLALHLVGVRAGWWSFDAQGGLFLGMPVELYLAWAWLWGAVPALAFPSLPVVAIAAIALGIDLVAMPAAAPLLRLGPGWLIGEVAGLALALIPAQLLARWTIRGEQLEWRATLQVIAFSGLMLFVLPAVIIAGSQTAWRNPLTPPGAGPIAQLLAVPALVGEAPFEFVTRRRRRCRSSPRRMVTSGIYPTSQPDKLSAVVLLVPRRGSHNGGSPRRHHGTSPSARRLGRTLTSTNGSATLAAYCPGAHVVPGFVHGTSGRPPAQLFVAQSCGMCSEVSAWFTRRRASHLTIVPAEGHASRALTRITYEAGDGSAAVSGVAAIARALEHIHVGWALVGCLLRLPIVRPLIQLLVDASGGEARTIPAISQ